MGLVDSVCGRPLLAADMRLVSPDLLFGVGHALGANAHGDWRVCHNCEHFLSGTAIDQRADDRSVYDRATCLW
jgi:hypothetical protein